MSSGNWSGSVSIYFFAGDFVDVLRRYEAGAQQIYATHDEVALLLHGLLAAKIRVNVYSFVTPEARDEHPLDGLRVISMGARAHAAKSILAAAVRRDDADAIVAHFPNEELLREVIKTNKRAIAVLASSYNRKGFRSAWRTRRLIALLNHRRFELVSNHCGPATRQLERLGVAPRKLIAWDVPHRFHPNAYDPKDAPARPIPELAYAGTIAEEKGVGDLIRAVAMLHQNGLSMTSSLAGLGSVDEMKALARSLGVEHLFSFRGLIGNTDVFDMFRSADLIAVPSRSGYPEGFPLTMFEALAARTPIVCTDHPMFRPVLEDGRNAAVFRSGDVEGFAAAIRRILEDRALYGSLSRAAPETWSRLEGTADWRMFLTEWVTRGSDSPWIVRHKLASKATA